MLATVVGVVFELSLLVVTAVKARRAPSPSFVPILPHVVLIGVETGPSFVPGLPPAVRIGVETGPYFVPGLHHACTDRS